ncbi:hypothetical protein A3D78_06595 [Candidatus Gottesmanbacteria bacterium RIFCSPHIGHO2_02_FULL_39_14]|uniref:Uncharacterized protein n=1 Tax=Candidatus Gottesmanbacteria bacterium RIFCSPHIGHO2_02_FULL_39_14 TaxID=1798383 RepID=A0A1F5ZY40_9BACT|nr:MAG: hypothetical protein A3D78_06595 [Candidatus Gottesmanbacteria bacterium RIFCSPHIGHO2_02_FULL_39_14]
MIQERGRKEQESELREDMLMVRFTPPEGIAFTEESVAEFHRAFADSCQMQIFVEPIVVMRENAGQFKITPSDYQVHDLNSVAFWRESNSSLYQYGEYPVVTVVAHTCKPIDVQTALAGIADFWQVDQMRYGLLSTHQPAVNFSEFTPEQNRKHILFTEMRQLLTSVDLKNDGRIWSEGARLEQLVLEAAPLFNGKLALILDPDLKAKSQELYQAYELQVEKGFVKQAVEGKVRSIYEYPLFNRYNRFINKVITAIGSLKGKRVAFCGSGPTPISAFLYYLKGAEEVVGFEKDPIRADESRELIAKMGQIDNIKIVNGLAEKEDLSRFDVVDIAALAHPKSEIIENLRKNREVDSSPIIIIRTTIGEMELLYKSPKKGFLYDFQEWSFNKIGQNEQRTGDDILTFIIGLVRARVVR